MKEALSETIIDGLKLLPFLFIAYLIMEYVEHKMKNKSKEVIKKSKKFGPVIGGLLGIVPQCGFSVTATNFYAGKIITLGTLIAVYLSTSDEMLPIMISEGVETSTILIVIEIKALIGILAGIIIDIFVKKNEEKNIIHDICENEHCHCENGILKSAIKHALGIFVFILAISLILNLTISIIGEEKLSSVITERPILGPVIAALVGLIPNCASSVVITELYVSKIITLGTLLAGLLPGAGVGTLVLFRTNKNIKENIKIISIIYAIGVIVGILFNIVIK